MTARGPNYPVRRVVALAVVVTVVGLAAVLVVSLLRTADPPVPDRRSGAGAKGDGGPPGSARPRCDRDVGSEGVARFTRPIMIGVAGDQPERAEALLTGPNPPGGIFVNSDIVAVDAPRWESLARRHPDMLLALDEEGGRVQRIDSIAGPLASAASQGTVAQIREVAKKRAAALRSIGIGVDFAPVVDLRSPSSEAVIGDRSYGADASSVLRRAGAFARGLREGGVLPTLKHFPGHGRAAGAEGGDSHESAVSTPPLDELRGVDLVPYRELLRDRPVAVMVGHLVVPGLTAGRPSSLSPAAYRLLRSPTRSGGLGFDGLVFTDDLGDMAAVNEQFGPESAAVSAIAAGADVALFHGEVDLARIARVIASAERNGTIAAGRLDDSARRIRAAAGCRAGQ
ncbi:MAG: glycoside hydrolase family 3 N-terminal domain-containing protein [Microthrixaceae bacterium]